MVRLTDDAFRIFISHKHEDHELAMTVKTQLEELIPQESADRPIDVFVSGDDIIAATDWNSTIRRQLASSHMLILLLTNSSYAWDWCLFETGLFARLDATEVHAIVCLHEDSSAPPGPLSSVQAVPANTNRIAKFLTSLCELTHEMSDDWRRGPLAKGDVSKERIDNSAKAIAEAFEETLAGVEAFYHPCHRVVLDVGTSDDGEGIPTDGRVVVASDQTSSFTLSLFGFGSAERKRTWGEFLDHLEAQDSDWRKQLDVAYDKALEGELFTPVGATFAAWDDEGQTHRHYKPLLYEIQRRSGDRKPVNVTIVFDRVHSTN